MMMTSIKNQKSKIVRHFVCFLVGMLFLGQLPAQQADTANPENHSYYFFDEEDIQNIRTSAQTDWGQNILSVLKEQVQKRRQHTLRVPYCSLCGRHWENVNLYDWAWVNTVHINQINSNQLIQTKIR